MEFDKLILKLQEKGREPRTAKTILEKNGEKGILPNYIILLLKLYIQYRYNDKPLTDRTESPEIDLCAT